MHDQPSSQSGDKSAQRAFHWVLLFIHGFALVTIVFLRRGFGDKYINVQAGVALLILLFFGAFFPGYDPTLLYVYLGAYILMCARHNISKRRGLAEHSMYSGTPRLMRFFGASEGTIKRRHEPLAVIALAFLTSLVDVPLGFLLLWSGVAIYMIESSAEQAVQARLREMNDLYLEQQSVLERFRHERGGRGERVGGYLD